MKLLDWLFKPSSWLSSGALPNRLYSRLVAFTIQRFLGRFLKNEIKSDDLNVLLSRGMLVLNELALDAESINNLWKHPQLSVVSGGFKQMSIQMSASDLWNGKIRVSISQLHVQLQLHQSDFEGGSLYEDAMSESDFFESLLNAAKEASLEELSQTDSLNHDSGLDSQSSRSIASMLSEKLMNSICLNVTDIKLGIVLYSSDKHLVCSIESERFWLDSLDQSTATRKAGIGSVRLSLRMQDELDSDSAVGSPKASRVTTASNSPSGSTDSIATIDSFKTVIEEEDPVYKSATFQPPSDTPVLEATVCNIRGPIEIQFQLQNSSIVYTSLQIASVYVPLHPFVLWAFSCFHILSAQPKLSQKQNERSPELSLDVNISQIHIALYPSLISSFPAPVIQPLFHQFAFDLQASPAFLTGLYCIHVSNARMINDFIFDVSRVSLFFHDESILNMSGDNELFASGKLSLNSAIASVSASVSPFSLQLAAHDVFTMVAELQLFSDVTNSLFDLYNVAPSISSNDSNQASILSPSTDKSGCLTFSVTLNSVKLILTSDEFAPYVSACIDLSDFSIIFKREGTRQAFVLHTTEACFYWKSSSKQSITERPITLRRLLCETHRCSSYLPFNVRVVETQLDALEFVELEKPQFDIQRIANVVIESIDLKLSMKVIQAFSSLVSVISMSSSNSIEKRTDNALDSLLFKFRFGKLSCQFTCKDTYTVFPTFVKGKFGMTIASNEVVDCSATIDELSCNVTHHKSGQHHSVISHLKGLHSSKKQNVNLNLLFSSSTNEQLVLLVSCVSIDHYYSFPWIQAFLETYFEADPEKPFLQFPSFAHSIELKFENVLLGFNCPTTYSRLLALMESASMLIDPIADPTQISGLIEVHSVRGFLIDNIDKSPLPKSSGVSPTFTQDLCALFKALGYVQIAQFRGLNIKAMLKLRQGQPYITLDVNSCDAHVSVCADSFKTLNEFLASVNMNEPASSSNSDQNTFVVRHSVELMSAIDKDFFNSQDMLLKLEPDGLEAPSFALQFDDDFFGSNSEQKLSSSPSEDIELVSSNSASSTFSEVLFQSPVNSSADVNLPKSDLPNIMFDLTENYFRKDDQTVSQVLQASTNVDNPFTLTFHDINVTVDLHDGYDWSTTRKTLAESIYHYQTWSSKKSNVEKKGSHPKVVYGCLCIDRLHTIEEPSEASLREPIDTPIPEFLKKRAFTLHLGRSFEHKTKLQLSNVCGHFLSTANPEMPYDILLKLSDLCIYDNMPTSHWNKVLSYNRAFGPRNEKKPFVQLKVVRVKPVKELDSSELRMTVHVAPCKLRFDQDTLDQLIRFFLFQPTNSSASVERPLSHTDAPYLQQLVFSGVVLSFDYKPKRASPYVLQSHLYSQLSSLFTLQNSQVYLREVVGNGLLGFDQVGKLLLKLWLSDIRHNQLEDVLSGIVPVRTLLTVGGGVKDLFVVPVKGYQEGHFMTELGKGLLKFAKTTFREAVLVNAQLATKSHGVMHRLEKYLQFEEQTELVSPYMGQPESFVKGLREGFSGLKRQLATTKSTIEQLPSDLTQQRDVASVARRLSHNVPLAFVKPMAGATEIVSKALLGLSNTLDPSRKQELKDKYKSISRSSSSRNFDDTN
ncbi:autophagy associated protein Atg2 [Schizosaccharomyces japonicus yFS275]|uniref:Autophagy-related protein 2 n=1 Tax=Schizosaccharomyces japonicus (strain yFS275 / FY16936) TaxID=402676 RepID=B6K582_SCHJY|nr:autophagy associated protein Atg2 [Schizosaccharomyces japonicus yFS275]EEB08686.1 autophagy associated protein Atg2 [Schizosaccharomyces japonicus yFS275]